MRELIERVESLTENILSKAQKIVYDGDIAYMDDVTFVKKNGKSMEIHFAVGDSIDDDEAVDAVNDLLKAMKLKPKDNGIDVEYQGLGSWEAYIGLK